MKHVDLEKFANGAFSAQVNRAIEEVTENIQNPNSRRVLIYSVLRTETGDRHLNW
mgnify:CR=1 FL=1